MELRPEAANPDGHPFAGPAVAGRIEPEIWPPPTSPSDVGREPDPLPPRAERVGEELFFSRPVIGYRSWGIDNDALVSEEAGGWRWRPGVNVAQCPLGLDHDAPAADCICGFAATHDSRDISATLADRLGLVAAHGRIMIHHNGFRAEEMVPLALAIDLHEGRPLFGETDSGASTHERQWREEQRRRLQRLSQRYSIPLVYDTALERHTAAHGQLIHYADLPDLPAEPAERPGPLKRLFGRLPATG
jgi:hypothetical protein